MKNNNQFNIEEFNKLKKENDMLKQNIKQIKQSFCFSMQQINMELSKANMLNEVLKKELLKAKQHNALLELMR